ncbi:VanZ family protein [Methanosarcina sp. MSH10X1]|uniref:VanZ family protein n=1 Tax=Methanosarcina sp. MSH10X1 TaxID=2507075 RepID=UPI0013E3A242|nr:VanZ family protein [Methanosarcina sp. MSH10X1]
MLRVKSSRVFVPATILYAIFVFYLSVTSNIGNLKHLIDDTLGAAAISLLTEAHLSIILKFLVGSLHFVERQSLDPGHIGIYFGLGVLLYFVFLSSRRKTLEKYSAVFAILTGTSYGILNEFFQTFLPYRTASVTDAFSNLLGLLLAQICVIVFVLALSAVRSKTIEEAN